MAKKYLEMKVKYAVMSDDMEIDRFDTEQKALKWIHERPADLMGSVEYWIKKVWCSD
jgi:hypothetical protein